MIALALRAVANPYVFGALLFALASISGALGYRVGHHFGDGVGYSRAVAENKVAQDLANAKADERIEGFRRLANAAIARAVATAADDKTRSDLEIERLRADIDNLKSTASLSCVPALRQTLEHLRKGY